VSPEGIQNVFYGHIECVPPLLDAEAQHDWMLACPQVRDACARARQRFIHIVTMFIVCFILIFI
jgi:hypothetical protein